MTAPSSEVFQQIGLITRQLHDTLRQLGVMPRLQQAADGLPDARSRLHYIAQKSGAAAEKVLNSVELAKAERRRIAAATRGIAEAAAADVAIGVDVANPVRTADAALMDLVFTIEGASERLDAHLTDIMLAQDFHDLTGQVVAKVVSLASDLEDSLVELLLQAAPPAQAQKVDAAMLTGPVVDPLGRTDVVADQGEVDDLLASLGF